MQAPKTLWRRGQSSTIARCHLAESSMYPVRGRSRISLEIKKQKMMKSAKQDSRYKSSCLDRLSLLSCRIFGLRTLARVKASEIHRFRILKCNYSYPKPEAGSAPASRKRTATRRRSWELCYASGRHARTSCGARSLCTWNTNFLVIWVPQ